MRLDRMILIGIFTAGIAGCGSDTTGISTPDLSHSPVDSAWKAVENLEYAYNTMDLDLVNATLSEDFTHCFTAGPQPGIVWDREQEMEWFIDLFEVADEISMTFYGSTEWPWSGDSTGQSLELQRVFSVFVFYELPDPWEGLQASGGESYICRPGSDNEWRICYQMSDQTSWWP
jgi:hypothetical protein